VLVVATATAAEGWGGALEGAESREKTSSPLPALGRCP
jgi:hypothetical protein